MTNTISNPTTTTDPATRVKRLVLAALTTTAVAALAGVGMLVFDPDAGSTLEGILGITAAVAGLLTAALAVAAVVTATATGLWSRLPLNWRYVVWALLAVGIARTIWSQVSHLV